MASVAKREWTSPDGKKKSAWVVRYVDSGGAHRSKQFVKKGEAVEFRKDVDHRLQLGLPTEKEKSPTIRELAELYIRSHEMKLRDGRIGQGGHKNLKVAMDRQIIPFLGDIEVRRLTANDVEQFYQHMRLNQKLGPDTAKAKVSVLRGLVDYAVRREEVNRNVVVFAQHDLKGGGRTEITTFTPDQVRKLLEACQTRAKWQHEHTFLITRLFVNLAAFCGLRRGEIFGLTIDSIDFQEGVVRVRNSLTDWNELKGPKTKAGIRDVPLPPHIAGLLREWIAVRYRENERRLLFLSQVTRATNFKFREGLRRKKTAAELDASNPQQSFYSTCWLPLLKRAGLYDKDDPLHFHALRHFAASWWIANGMPLTDTASLLGHKKFDLTLQVYAHPIVGGRKRSEALERMSSLLLNGPAVTIDAAPVPAGF